MDLAGIDLIIAQSSPVWEFLRAVHVLLAITFMVLLAMNLVQRWSVRSRQGNLLIVAVWGLVLNSVFTALSRFGGPVSFRLVIALVSLAVGVFCLVEPTRRRDRDRTSADLV